MKVLLRGLLGLAVLAVAGVLFAPGTARAAEGFNVITSPLPIKLTTQPGKTVETELRIKNQGTQAEGINVSLMKFKGGTENGSADLQDITKDDAFASWVKFTPSKFLAQPGVWNTVKMRIEVPKTAGLGYYMAASFSPVNVPGGRDVTSLRGSAATLVLLNVKDANEKRDLAISEFTSKHKVYEYLPASFNIKIRNNGNIYVPPVGNIFILKGDKLVDTLEFNTVGGSVLPNSSRRFSVPWANGFPVFKDSLKDGKPQVDKNGNYKQDLRWNFGDANKFRFGKYTARLLAVYDDGQRDVPLESTVTFWVIPWKAILLLLMIISLIGLGIFGVLRGAVRKAKSTRVNRKPKA